MKKYRYYYRSDASSESISITLAPSRLKAAKWFAAAKRLPLKEFLKIYSVSR
jgi:hypothetical protein